MMGADNSSPAGDERKTLMEKQAQLAVKLEALRREQDYLLFQKGLQTSDSKYLVIDLAGSKGVLKYRNRVLRSFDFISDIALRKTVQPGMLRIIDRTDGSDSKKSLVVGDAFVIKPKHYSGRSGKVPGMTVNSKDFAAVYYAVEKDTLIYIKR